MCAFKHTEFTFMRSDNLLAVYYSAMEKDNKLVHSNGHDLAESKTVLLVWNAIVNIAE